MTLEEMCSSCIHRNYCMSADCKDHWLLFCKLNDAPVVTLNDAITV